MNSLSTQQVAHLGEIFDHSFNLYKESGFRESMPIPRQTAAETLLYYCRDEEDIVRVFTLMLAQEGKHFYGREMTIWGKEEFISALKLFKWIYDPALKQFFLDPFYEHEINFLRKVRIIDLLGEINMTETIKQFAEISKKMSIKDLEWRIAMRLYDLERQTGELIRKIIDMLLSRQNLQMYTGELFFCLKELAINASKANYKILFEKHFTSKEGITSEKNYAKFLELFKNEIEENGNSNLFELAKKEDRHYTITFQSTFESIEIWVTNDQNISLIEKEQILKKLSPERLSQDSYLGNDDDVNTEGAGLGLSMVLNVLKTYSDEVHPLKVIFYPDYVKIGFELKRAELLAKMPANN